MRYLWIVALVAACSSGEKGATEATEPATGSTPTPAPTASTGSVASTGSTADSGTPSGPPCEAIEGADGVVVVSLSAPEHLVGPQVPAGGAGAVTLAGPGPNGFAYLGDHGGRVLRSADGCTWEHVGQLPIEMQRFDADTGGRPSQSYYLAELFVSAHTERLYVHDIGTQLWVSDDGGATFTTLPGAIDPGWIGVDPVDEDHLRMFGIVDGEGGLFDSTDGGQSWTSLPFDAPEGLRSAAVARSGAWSTMAAWHSELAVTDDDGATWATIVDDCDVSDVVLDAEGLSFRCLEHIGDVYAPTPVVTARRTTDLGATFVELPVTDDAGFYVRGSGFGAGALVSAGFTLDGAQVEVTTLTDTYVHPLAASLTGNTKGVVVLGDRAVIATD